MTSREFFHKFNSTYIWGNILAIVILVLILSIGVRFGLDYYRSEERRVGKECRSWGGPEK